MYQAFRWWGVGTIENVASAVFESVSSVPMVGCRNAMKNPPMEYAECIKRSDGGVSERLRSPAAAASGSVSSVPMVGCRNESGR